MTTSLHTFFHSLSELLGALRGPGTAEKQGAEAAPSLCALPELTRGERLTRSIADEAMPTSEVIRRLKDEIVKLYPKAYTKKLVSGAVGDKANLTHESFQLDQFHVEGAGQHIQRFLVVSHSFKRIVKVIHHNQLSGLFTICNCQTSHVPTAFFQVTGAIF